MRTKRVFTYFIFPLCCLLALPVVAISQSKETLQGVDSVNTVTATIDSTADGKKVKKVRVYNPGKAAIRSAILPGWGQAYNKKYWKIPIVYGALGTTAAIFFFNLQTYKDTRLAYTIKYNMSLPTATAADSARFDEIPVYLQPISTGSLRAYRDSYRRDIDYSILFFVLFWGLNVVDAAVDAHLKSFDVSPDLSLRFKPGYSPMANTTGMSFVVHIGQKKQTTLLPSRF
jgi:hypothetical protein